MLQSNSSLYLGILCSERYKNVTEIVMNNNSVKPNWWDSSAGTTGEDSRLVAQSIGFIEKVFILDPNKPVTMSEELKYPNILKRWCSLVITLLDD